MGFKHSAESKRKMSEARSKNPVITRYWLGKKRPPFSEEWKKRIGEGCTGEKSYLWKGDGVGYRAFHSWVKRHKGEATFCHFCGKVKTKPKEIQWANKSHKYLRKLTDWISLCVPCHKKYDISHRRSLV